MPRRKTAVKPKLLRTPGLVDIHFHGAFGIDLMSAKAREMTELARRLGEHGIAAFCPTTLSVGARDLLATVRRIGTWIRKGDHRWGALPLGIHLEGPFISREACGAHPPRILRKPHPDELDVLWASSFHTLKILTVAPELLTPKELKTLASWCAQRNIVLSLGHSRATEQQAQDAFRAGFSNVTHAWNAMAFHQRTPGVLGAALGNPDVFLELIADQVHVSPTLLRWTRQLHPPDRVCFVSDCAPAAALGADQAASFGPLTVYNRDGACRLPDGGLAGGGRLLSDAFARWVESEAETLGIPCENLLEQSIGHVSRAPLESLRLIVPNTQEIERRMTVSWRCKDGHIDIDSLALRG